MRIIAMHRLLTLSLFAALSASTAWAVDSHDIHWTYDGPQGPEHWAVLNEGFHACELGQVQSPIDILSTSTADLPAIRFRYGTIPTEIVNNGHTIQVNVPAGHSIVTDGEEYQLMQFHFHTPSEYHIEGKEYPLELHLVHKNAKGALAVVGVMIEEGPVNTELEDIFWNAPEKSGTTAKLETIETDLSKFLPKQDTYFKFMGSLTTPPCSEGVSWHMMTTPITASMAQIAKFKERFQMNARPLQPMNGRLVVRDIN